MPEIIYNAEHEIMKKDIRGRQKIGLILQISSIL